MQASVVYCKTLDELIHYSKSILLNVSDKCFLTCIINMSLADVISLPQLNLMKNELMSNCVALDKFVLVFSAWEHCCETGSNKPGVCRLSMVCFWPAKLIMHNSTKHLPSLLFGDKLWLRLFLWLITQKYFNTENTATKTFSPCKSFFFYIEGIPVKSKSFQEVITQIVSVIDLMIYDAIKLNTKYFFRSMITFCFPM